MSKLILSIPAETQDTRVALTPKHVRGLKRLFKEIRVQDGAGRKAGFSNTDFRRAGAKIVRKLGRLVEGADIILEVKRPAGQVEREYIKSYREDATVIGFLDAQVENRAHLGAYATFGVTGYSFELMPQNLHTQSMHATAAMSRITGEVVIAEATEQLDTLQDKRVLVIGMGNAGLAAAKQAKSQGAIVTALSTTATHKKELESLGIIFDLLQDERAQTVSPHVALRMQREHIGRYIGDKNVIVCAARRVGEPAPLLITKDMQSTLKSGTMVFDLTKSSGGNFEGGVYGQNSTIGNVQYRSQKGYPKTVPEIASPMYAGCAAEFLRALLAHKCHVEVTNAILTTCVTANGLVNPDCIPGVKNDKFAENAGHKLIGLRERARG